MKNSPYIHVILKEKEIARIIWAIDQQRLRLAAEMAKTLRENDIIAFTEYTRIVNWIRTYLEEGCQFGRM